MQFKEMLDAQKVYLEKHIKVHERDSARVAKKLVKAKEFVGYGRRDNERAKSKVDQEWLAKQKGDLNVLLRDNEIKARTNELCQIKIVQLEKAIEA